MRYAIFTDIHANLEALKAVLAKIDELAQDEPIDEIWFLGDLVGYGPNPNECIDKLTERTNVIIAGNHDWAAVGKIDLEDFSAAARISAEWTAEQLTEEHREFLINLPERIEKGDCTLVHGSPYGPLWEYLTSEALAERSFQYFESRFCLVGHTHVPVIFQQPDTIASLPTMPLSSEQGLATSMLFTDVESVTLVQDEDDEETTKISAIHLPATQTATAPLAVDDAQIPTSLPADGELRGTVSSEDVAVEIDEAHLSINGHNGHENSKAEEGGDVQDAVTPEDAISNAEERLNSEIEELLTLLGLSESMVKVTNEMIDPPIGLWKAPQGFRAIINPGGVGQPRDGDPRAAFMIYDTVQGFTFYRVPYAIEKTQEKIIKAGLPSYLATRLNYGR